LPGKENSMSAIPAFSRIRVGQPIRHETLTVFPLFPSGATTEEVDYLLSDEAVAAGAVTVEEVSESGSVPTLQVTNRGDHRVLFLEGEELRGAKQNRVLNTSVLIGAGTKTTIPVSCVEQGRWRFRSREFSTSENYSSSKLRHRLKQSVTESLRRGHGHMSDQGAIWGEVSRQMAAFKASSETHAMADTYESHRARLEEFRSRLAYVEGATGLAVAVGPRIVALDLFDKPSTCRKIWDRLLSGFAMDALEERRTEVSADSSEVEELLKRLETAAWQESPAVGEGREFRSGDSSETHASALTFSSSLLHGSAVVGAAGS
jgi:hypothetical protein